MYNYLNYTMWAGCTLIFFINFFNTSNNRRHCSHNSDYKYIQKGLLSGYNGFF